MNAIQEVKDEAIRKVAQTLRASGLAMSETEAVRMAMMMSKTSQKVTQNFDSKKNGATMATHFNEVSDSSSNIISPKNHVNASPSVQEKPRKYEEKEEFIFGDSQDSAQKKDVYSVNNEFEEIVSQELVSTKPVQKQAEVAKPVVAPVAKPAPVTITTSPISAQGSSQMAFSFMLGSAQKNAAYEEEIRKHTPQAETPAPSIKPTPVHVINNVKPVAPVAKPAPAAPAYNHNPRPFPQPAPRVAAQRPVQAPEQSSLRMPAQTQVELSTPAVKPAQTVTQSTPVVPVQQVHAQVQATPVASPQKKMMQEANVDLSKMFNFNK